MTLGAARKNLTALGDLALADRSPLERLRKPGWSFLAVTSLLLLSILGAVLLSADNWKSGSDIIQSQKIQVVTFRIVALMQNAETGQRGYLLTGKTSYLEPFDRSMSRVQPALDELLTLAKEDPTLADEAIELNRLAQQKLAELRTTIAAFDRGGPAAALPIVTTDEGKLAMDQIRALAREILDRESATLSTRTLQWQRNSNLLIVTSGLAIALTILGAAMTVRTQKYHAAAIETARAKLAEVNVGLEESVAIRTADLKEANEEIQRYAHIASHDLRSPLVNIMGYSGELEIVRQELLDLLEAEPAVSPDTRARLGRLDADFVEALSFIRQSIDKMNRLINAILKLARSGKREFRYEDLDMTVVFTSIKAMLQHQLTTKDISFEIAPMPHIIADRLAVEQIFSNLAENAIKYLDPGRPGRITVMARPDGIGVAFVLADNGRGIGQKDLGRIFDPFRRAGPQDQPGEGIGLAHVRMLVRRLGGRVTCESDVGIGSRFVVSLPLVANKMGD